MEKFGTRPKTEQQETDHAEFAMHQTGAQYTSVQHKIQTAITAERKDTTHGHANKEQRITEQ